MLKVYADYLSLNVVDSSYVIFDVSNAVELFNLLRKTINCRGFIVVKKDIPFVYLVNKKDDGMDVLVIIFDINYCNYYYKFLDYIVINCERTEMLNKCFGGELKDYYISKLIYV